MSSIMGGKAIALVTRGGVRKVNDTGLYEADGSSPGTVYRVQLGAQQSCTCRAGECGRDCYHVHAAKLLSAQLRRQ